jgi:hypothetical protein
MSDVGLSLGSMDSTRQYPLPHECRLSWRPSQRAYSVFPSQLYGVSKSGGLPPIDIVRNGSLAGRQAVDKIRSTKSSGTINDETFMVVGIDPCVILSPQGGGGANGHIGNLTMEVKFSI